MFRPIGSLVPEALNRLKVQKPVEASQVCRLCDEELGRLWDHAVPMRALSFSAGVITVAVTGSAWAHEVAARSETLKDKLNAKVKNSPVKRIRTKVAPTAARGDSN